MSRVKKKRSDANIIIRENAPRRSEKLADPDSYESRKKRAQDKKRVTRKKVYEKELEKSKTGSGGKQQPNRGPLADKIRKLNAAKKEQGAAE